MRIKDVKEVTDGFRPMEITLKVEREEDLNLLIGFLYLDVFNDIRGDEDTATLDVIAGNHNVVLAIQQLDMAVKTDIATYIDVEKE